MSAGLTAMGTASGVLIAYFARKTPSNDDEQPPTAPPPSPGIGPVTMPLSLSATSTIPATADGQLELAKMLVQEVNADRAALRQELDQERAERRAERAETQERMREHEEEIEQLKMRVSELAGINAQLRYVLQANGFPLPPGL